MISKAGKSSANQNGGRISVRYLELETEHPPMPPTQLSKHLISKSGGLSYCALGAAAVRIRFSSVILNLEERWAEFAQLFAFYWDLTRNKFSFPLSFFVTRSPLFIWTFGLTPSWNLEEIDSAIIWSTGQAYRNWMKTINGSQAPRSGSIRHITYVRVGDNRALFRN